MTVSYFLIITAATNIGIALGEHNWYAAGAWTCATLGWACAALSEGK